MLATCALIVAVAISAVFAQPPVFTTDPTTGKLLAQLPPGASSVATCASGAPPTFLLPLLHDANGNVTCMEGFNCPLLDPLNASTWPVACVAQPECSLRRGFGNICKIRQSDYEPVICESGMYCPTPQIMKECPEGSFCLEGQSKPTKCSSFSICPAGSIKPRNYGVVIWAVLIFIIVVVIHQVYIRVLRPKLYISSREKPSRAESMAVLCEAINRIPAGGEMEFQFKDLAVDVPVPGSDKRKKLLNGVDGKLAPGQVTAIMGPSGAGKTTLFNALLGRLDSRYNVTGELTVNGRKPDYKNLKPVLALVPQDDVMHAELTVAANIHYSAALRLPSDWSNDSRQELCDAVVNLLGLWDHRSTIVGDAENTGLSGGQRKRASIAVELASAPIAIFLDEPTSGLDATTSLELCNVLKKVARATNLTVAMVVHQPRIEIYNALDVLLILGVGGFTAYYGPQDEAKASFEERGVFFPGTENPADIIMDALSEHSVELASSWTAALKAPKEGDALKSNKATSPASATAAAATAVEPQNNINDEEMIERREESALVPTVPQQQQDQAQGEEDVVVEEMKGEEEAAEGEGEEHHRSSSTPRSHEPAQLSDDDDNEQEATKAKTSPTTATNPIERPTTAPAENEEGEQETTQRQGRVRIATPPPKSNDEEEDDTEFNNGASIPKQIFLIHVRSVEKQLSRMTAFYVEVAIGLLCGLILGQSQGDFQPPIDYAKPYDRISPIAFDSLLPQLNMYAHMSLGLASSVAGVQVLGNDRSSTLLREIGWGTGRTTWFLGMVTAGIYRVCLAVLAFWALYHFIGSLLTQLFSSFVVYLFVYWAIYGFSAILSMCLDMRLAPLLASTLTICFAVFSGFIDFPKPLKVLSYSFWSSQVSHEEQYSYWKHNAKPNFAPWDYEQGQTGLGIFVLLLMGVVYHGIALGVLWIRTWRL